MAGLPIKLLLTSAEASWLRTSWMCWRTPGFPAAHRCYLVPPTAAAEYPARIREILLQESPDLILCCRDEDTLALSQLKSQHPELPGVLPVGTPGPR